MPDLRKLIASLLALLLAGCGSPRPDLPPLPTVDSVDLSRYTGTWHEIARLPNKFQKGCQATTANYSQLDSGKVRVVNRCTVGDDVRIAEGKAKVVADSGNARLKVTFFWPFYGDYWIVDLDNNYQWAVIGEPSREYLWILAREPKLQAGVLESILARLPSWGYDPDALIFQTPR